MDRKISIEELKTVIALKDMPEAHLSWILEHGEHKEYEEGTILTKTGDPVDELWLITEGKGDFYLDVNGRLVHYYTFENNEQSGGVGGMLPFSRMRLSPGYTFMVGRGRILLLHKRFFPELEKLNPELIQRLIGYMTERARVFATLRMQQEKVSALGKLSAGIAHELNNPASAISSIADELNKRLLLNYDLTRQLLHQKIDPKEIDNLQQKVILHQTEAEKKTPLTAIQKLEKEDEIRNWLEASGLQDCRQQSEAFSEAGWSAEELENICRNVGSEALCDLLHWLENLLTSSGLLKDLADASARISTLVGAIKSHVHMDRTMDKVPTNIHIGIESTLTLLGYKIREKNIEVKKRFSDSLPPVDAFVGELNQVWNNLIDNAVFAVNPNGELIIETAKHDGLVTVTITDNGAGIPSEIKPHIFDPYFTTKPAGEGSGIGLEIVNRIVQTHNGSIDVQSEPGRTTFTVNLPIAQPQKAN